MAAKFGRLSDDDEPKNERRTPNYFSRNMQFRMMGLVAALMLVVVLMVEAGKPKNWRWLWAGEKKEVEKTEPPRKVDTKLPPVRSTTKEPGVIVPQDEKPAINLSNDALTRTIQKGWSRVWSRLSVADRDTLWSTVYHGRNGLAPSKELQQKTPAMIEAVDRRWKSFYEDVFQSVVTDDSDLPPKEAEMWLEVAQKLQSYWQNQTALLKSISEDDGKPKSKPDDWRELQTHLDAIAHGLIRDNTVWRYEEKYAWFRIFESWLNEPTQKTQNANADRVGYIELFDQTDEYRGKPVTLSGTVKLAYRVSAPRNDLGITEYTVLWVKPTGGPNSPIVVYSLEPPADFPKLKHKEKDGETSTLNHEPIEVTGTFFKRWAYRAQDGSRVAPMVLASTFEWQGEVPVDTGPVLPSVAVMIITIVLLAVAAILIAVVVWVRSRWRVENPSELLEAENSVARLASLNESDLAPNVADQLKQLEETDS